MSCPGCHHNRCWIEGRLCDEKEGLHGCRTADSENRAWVSNTLAILFPYAISFFRQPRGFPGNTPPCPATSLGCRRRAPLPTAASHNSRFRIHPQHYCPTTKPDDTDDKVLPLLITRRSLLFTGNWYLVTLISRFPFSPLSPLSPLHGKNTGE
jgi:hypothetical protein